ncbi:hypothetical protein MRB53_041510 [Persea americana]|nr:hypothetical protein MRB53_041510 [Persea americana]
MKQLTVASKRKTLLERVPLRHQHNTALRATQATLRSLRQGGDDCTNLITARLRNNSKMLSTPHCRDHYERMKRC